MSRPRATSATAPREFFGPAPFDPAVLVLRRRMMTAVLVLSFGVLAVKVAAWWWTGSQALLSDALESVANVVTGGFALFSVVLAGRPPDRSHPYGHGKVEHFAAGLEGALILVAAVGIVREAAPRLLDPQPIANLGLGATLSTCAAALNGVAGVLLVRYGRRSGSATFGAEGRHLLSDTITTAGVLAGLGLVHATGWLVLDPLAACVVAASVAWSGIGLLRESASRLMDRADAALLAEIVRALESVRRPEWIEAHLLRAWRSGEFVHIDFHLTLPRYWTMDRIHASQHELLRVLLPALGRPGEILVHPDPCVASLCPGCRVEPCPVRTAPCGAAAAWSVDRITGGPLGHDEDSCQVAQAEASRHIQAGVRPH